VAQGVSLEFKPQYHKKKKKDFRLSGYGKTVFGACKVREWVCGRIWK
jgi:hypothetical protein